MYPSLVAYGNFAFGLENWAYKVPVPPALDPNVNLFLPSHVPAPGSPATYFQPSNDCVPRIDADDAEPPLPSNLTVYVFPVAALTYCFSPLVFV